MITVALTSIPPRFSTLADRLAAILAQAPARVCLTIPDSYSRFPGWDGHLPDLPDGVTLLRGPDHGPASKFTAAFAAWPETDMLIADDDCDYRAGWLDAFRTARAAHPDAVIAASSFDVARLGLTSGHRIVQGFAGVLLRPGWLGPAVLDPSDPARWVDDIWLSAHLAAAGVPVVDCPLAGARVNALEAPGALQDAEIAGQTRAGLNRHVARQLAASLRIWTDPVSP